MFLIKNGRIWDGEKFFYGDVLTDGAVISQIGQNLTCEKGYIFDAKGCIVAPGLVDGHIHMHGLSIPKYGIPAESACFPFGVTAAADVLGQSRWGRLQVGGIADIAVLEDTDEGFALKNRNGNILDSPTGYRCILTISNGIIVHCDKWR